MNRAAFVVRLARPEDAQVICDLSRRAIQVSAAGHYTLRQLRAWAGRRTVAAHERMIRDTTVLVAVDEVNEAVMGFASIALSRVGALEDGEVDQLFVHPACGGRGIAPALLAEIEAAAHVAGLAQLVTHASWRALPVFERCGYRRVDVETVHIEGVELTRVRMIKPLGTDKR